MWTLIRKIWENRKLYGLIKIVITSLADGKISKDEAKKILCEAVDAFMKET